MFDFSQLFTPESLAAFGQVIMIDLVLAGDNAVVIGLAAAGLPADQRKKAILVGIIAATVLRIAFAGVALQLLQIVGLLFAGGVLLAWVSWKMFRELRTPHHHEVEAVAAADLDGDGKVAGAPRKTFFQASLQILIADVSMSLDNVLAVAGAARDHPNALIFGLVLSILLMGVASVFIANLLNKHRWIAWVGLLIIVYVSGDMMYRGFLDLLPYIRG